MSDLWTAKALERHRELGLPVETLLRSHDMLRSIVGQGWLDAQAAMVERAGEPFVASPFYRMLSDPTEVAIVQTCELALYLETFKDDPEIGGVLADLKSAKFEPVLFELGLAYRWKRAGAVVTLRPPTPKGKVADYQARIDGLPFTVEASVFPRGDEARIPFHIVRCVQATLQKRIPVNVKVCITSYGEGNFEAALHAAVRAVCLAMKTSHAAGNHAPIRSEEPFGTIEVELLGPDAEPNPFTRDAYKRVISTREHEWHAVVEARTVAKDPTVPLYHIASAAPEPPNSVIFVRFPDAEKNVMADLQRKLRTENKQLSGTEGPRVIVLDATALADTLQLDRTQLEEMILPFLASAPTIACVWLVMRRWQTSLRYRYEGLYIANPESLYQLPQAFASSLFQNEWKLDFLTEREFSDASEEEAARSYAQRMQ